MHKPSTVNSGVRGTIGTAGQTVATTTYSVGTSFLNATGDRYVAVTVKCDKAFDLYCFGDSVSWSSTADAGAGATYGKLLSSSLANPINGTATTGGKGKTFFISIATMKYVLPVVYQAAGTPATVTITYQTYND